MEKLLRVNKLLYGSSCFSEFLDIRTKLQNQLQKIVYVKVKPKIEICSLYYIVTLEKLVHKKHLKSMIEKIFRRVEAI